MQIDAFFAKVEEESTSHVLLHFKSNKDPMRFFFPLFLVLLGWFLLQFERPDWVRMRILWAKSRGRYRDLCYCVYFGLIGRSALKTWSK